MRVPAWFVSPYTLPKASCWYQNFPLSFATFSTSSMRANDCVYQACLSPVGAYCAITESPSSRYRVVPSTRREHPVEVLDPQ